MHKLYRVRFDSESHFHTCIEIIYNLYVSKYVLQLLQGSLATHAICGTDPNGSSSVIVRCRPLSVVRCPSSCVVVVRRRGREGCEWGDELAGGGIYSPGPFLSLAVGVGRRVCAIFVAFAPLSRRGRRAVRLRRF